MKALIAVLLLATTVACGRSARRSDADPAGGASSPSSTDGRTDSDAGAGPVAASAGVTREARERAVLDLLADVDRASRLPVAAADPGKALDPQQRDRVAPRHIPTLQQGELTVTDGVPVEVVRRIVRQNFGRFRLCYENALRTAPSLAGTVVVGFVIDKSGSATRAEASKDSTIADPQMRACVARGFGNLSFPEPEHAASVTVTAAVSFDFPG